MLDPEIKEELASYRQSIDNIDAALVHMLAERFRCELERQPLQLPALSLSLTCSSGVGGYQPLYDDSSEAFYKRVDDALYPGAETFYDVTLTTSGNLRVTLAAGCEVDAFVFAAEEDFGIAPLEAQASGTPVIAYGRGGVLETIRGLDSKSPTGLLFERQDIESIKAAVARFERVEASILPLACRNNVMRFAPAVFQERFRVFVEHHWEQFQVPPRGFPTLQGGEPTMRKVHPIRKEI